MRREDRQTDAELLEAVKGGTASAYGTLYRRHAAAARCLARQLVPGDDEVEDVLVETFARLLEVIREGDGPGWAFRPWLLASLRRYAATGEVEVTGDAARAGLPGDVYVPPDFAGLERSPLARAYLSLPERLRTALWHAEVEGTDPAGMAPHFGMSAGGVTGLARAARDALRQAYVRLHLEAGPHGECRPILPRIIPHVEGELPLREARLVDEHVAECIDCRAVLLELADVTQGLRVVVGQLVAGPDADDYLGGIARAADPTPGRLPQFASRMRFPGLTRLAGSIGLSGLAGVSGGASHSGSAGLSGSTGALGPLRRGPLAGVPTPYRAVIACVAAASLATAAFLLVVRPAAVERPALSLGASRPVRTPAGEGDVPMGSAGGADPGSPGGSAGGSAGGSGAGSAGDSTGNSGADSAGGPTTTAASSGREGPGASTDAEAARPPQTRQEEPGERRGPTPVLTREQVRGTGDRAGRHAGEHAGDQAGERADGLALDRAGDRAGDSAGETLGRLGGVTGAARPALAATIDTLGALLRAQPGLIAIRLRNEGASRSREVRARVTLPPGVTLIAPAGRTVDGWACRGAGHLVRCARGALSPGEVTAIFLRVAVAPDAPVGRGPGLSVRAGGARVAATSSNGVRSSGVAARFAADGRVITKVVGNTLVGSAPSPPACADGTRPLLPATGVPVPVDLDQEASTRSSSCARLDLPPGSRVLWAGLYWAAGGRGVRPASSIRLRAPGAREYSRVRAAEVTGRDLSEGSAYQAFADVTSAVRAAGRGRWWVADAGRWAGAVRHAGWSLVVVAADERQPYTRVVVLDTAAVVSGAKGALRVPLDGLAPVATPARIDLVVWNGEGVRGGVVTLGERSRNGPPGRRHAGEPGAGQSGDGDSGGLGSTGGSGGLGSAGVSPGAAVAVDTIHALLGPRPVLQLKAGRDTVFFGVAAVSARGWS
ncbi:hypothetical protein JOL79_32270 [Microbispora sp. RL4-1S]|uniref:Sigma-70 family RNA polymerase sigma factor n=1 Tax=Microbispora oryzae TaxID=2806554 RepID=A0A940WN16_9ACTN|nr:sigma factor [Microbispora oryzae]MBP2708466.1 hypothetical protein [Microbispora oryzae]